MPTWKTRGGEILDMKDMSTNHIKNTLKMLERNEAKIGYALMAKFETFASTLTGEIATMHADSIIDAFYDDNDDYDNMNFDITMYPPYKALKRELVNRVINT